MRTFGAVRQLWQTLRSSFWFMPAMIVLAGVGLAAGLVAVDLSVDLHVIQRWPLLFGASAAGSRGLLTAVATSMITVSGVVFSVTIVALSLTSSQYTSRVLRNFMRDPVNQGVLGVFLGIFAYCLVVLRTIREAEEGGFVPSLAVLVGLLLAFLGIAFLVYFIHHIAMSIQASSIISRAAGETMSAVDHLFPDASGEESDAREEGDEGAVLASPTRVASGETGYIVSVDHDALLSLAREWKRVVRMDRGVGEFVIEGAPLASMTGSGLGQKETKDLRSCFVINSQRTVQQDPAFGIRQIADVALKALSPGINDPTTAVMCVDYLAAILSRIAARRIAGAWVRDDGELRLITRRVTFESLLAEAFDQIRLNSGHHIAVLIRMLQAFESIAGEASSVSRRRSIQRQAELVAASARRAVTSPREQAHVDACLTRLARMFEEGEALTRAV